MTQLFPISPRCHVSALRLITALAIVSLIALAAGCGMTSRPNTPASPTPTPTPTPDTQPPTSTITSPRTGATVTIGVTVTITGTASDTGGGSVARVDVSVDGGATYNTAMGTTTWSYNWTPTSLGPASIRSRATDTSGNQQNPPTEITVTSVTLDATPQIVSTTPEPGATGVSTGIAPVVTFSKPLTIGIEINTSPDNETILLRDASNNPIHFYFVYDSGPSKFVLLPQEQLQPGQTYTVTFKGGPNAPHITDEAGTPLASDYNLSFTTAPSGVGPQIVSVTPAPGEFNIFN